jgi:hypothetical protein
MNIQDGRWCEINLAEDRDGWPADVTTEIMTVFRKNGAAFLGLTEELLVDEELCVSTCTVREDQRDCVQQVVAGTEWECLVSLRNRCAGVACERQRAALFFY